ncbi:hypothetical protein [Candidatus Nanohalovita haloferacivicina]|uniref:hypothetical protein n=1 Tax=Candidatus Nanohalovita haloferacivicina TaxID=2978046 RepID=UPI00325FDB82|nr:hypothetical protein HBNXNv_1030 [Candidatus Nanohalobia archaeon BNXNv]
MPEDEDVENELRETEEEIKGLIESIEKESSTPEETSVTTPEDDDTEEENTDEKETVEKDGKYIDKSTGKKFDTEEGLELFQQATQIKDKQG